MVFVFKVKYGDVWSSVQGTKSTGSTEQETGDLAEGEAIWAVKGNERKRNKGRFDARKQRSQIIYRLSGQMGFLVCRDHLMYNFTSLQRKEP